METVKISDLFSRDLYNGVNSSMQVPDWVFKPDQWSSAFLRGLRRVAKDLSHLRLWEIGVGSGVNLILLRKWVESGTWYYSDYDSRCVPLATANLESARVDLSQYRPLPGKWDLTTPPADNGYSAPVADVVFGCLPQVPTEMDLSSGDRIAHYYNPFCYPGSKLHAVGLGLNEALLAQAQNVLTPGGVAILNLGGRPGLLRLKEMFRCSGYQPKVIYEEMIPQHKETSLASFADLEAAGQRDFEFFADTNGFVRINARKAEDRRVSELPVFHKIYVIAGTLI